MKKVFLLVLNSLFILHLQAQPVVMEDAPLNVVIIVNHSMSFPYLAAGMLKNKDSLFFSKMQTTGFMKSWLKGLEQPDPFVYSSAIASGAIVQPGNLSEDAWGKPLKTLFEDARERRMATGIITTSSITHTPMLSFLFHQPSLKKDEEIAALLANNTPDIVFAGGSKYFIKRADKKDLLEGLKAKHYILEDNFKKFPQIIGTKIFALSAEDDIPYEQLNKGFLYKATESAIANQIGNRDGGYFYVVENTKNARLFGYNKIEFLADEAIEFSKMVENIVRKAGSRTLVVVLGDEDAGMIELAAGNSKKAIENGTWQPSQKPAQLLPVFANGPMAEKFTGIINRTDVFRIITQILQAR